MNRPRAGSDAKLCTEISAPERTKKVPSKLRPKVTMDRIITHDANWPRFLSTILACNRPVADNHGMSDAFSTGSQNHQPPQPSSRYAHQLPRPIPSVSELHAASNHGCTARAQWRSALPVSSAAMASENTIENPT